MVRSERARIGARSPGLPLFRQLREAFGNELIGGVRLAQLAPDGFRLDSGLRAFPYSPVGGHLGSVRSLFHVVTVHNPISDPLAGPETNEPRRDAYTTGLTRLAQCGVRPFAPGGSSRCPEGPSGG